MIIIPIKWLFHWEYTLFSDKPICYGDMMEKPWVLNIFKCQTNDGEGSKKWNEGIVESRNAGIWIYDIGI